MRFSYISGFVVFLSLLGGRSALASPSQTCKQRFPDASLELTATAIESDGRWIALRVGNRSDEILSIGESTASCFSVERIERSGAMLRELDSGELRFITLTGQTGRNYSPPQQLSIPRDVKSGSIESALLNAHTEQITDNVVRLRYPSKTNTGDLPRTLYTNKDGERFFSDPTALGLGEGAKPVKISDQYSGIELGVNERNSFLGGIGLIKGEAIVSINSRAVNSVEDLGSSLKEAGNRPIEVVYYDPAQGGLLTTYAMLR